MSISFMAEVVRISDRFFDRKDPDSIDRQGQLNQVLVVVVIFHTIMGIAFVKMEEYERKHPRIIRDVNVNFEFTAPPPAPEFRVGDVPKPITLTEGENPDSGSASAAKPLESDKVSLPTPKAEETMPVPTPEQARPVVSRVTSVSAPVAVTQQHDVKAAPVQAPKSSPKAPPNAATAGTTSNTPASGAPQEGGSPDGKEGGVGPGGDGMGGQGNGEGDPGTGTGYGTVGGEIATKVSGTRAVGNIAPYRKSLLVKIAANWHPKRKNEQITVQLSIGKDGTLLSCEIIESSGNKRSDAEAEAAVEATEFDPLPEWFRGEQLTFRIDLSRVEGMQ